MSARLRNIIELTRRLDEEYTLTGVYGPDPSREVILVEALAYLARIVDNYIDAQGDHVARAHAYQALFEAVRNHST